MPKFYFTAEVTVSATTTVEADSEEKAREIAEERTVRLSRGAGDEGNAEEWVIDEADGDAEEIQISGSDE
jgi:hypothetical protein